MNSLIGIGVYWFFFRQTEKKFDSTVIKVMSNNTVNRSNSMSDAGFVAKMRASGRNVIVFYGSQTGTAEEFASRLAKDATRYGFKAMVADPEEFDMEDLTNLTEIDNHLAIFCLATYGEGDPTDNALEFYEWLNNSAQDLKGLKFTVFGLGNKTYEHYNETAKVVDKKLGELGGIRIHDLGTGDDDANIEDDFITWKDQMWASVAEHYHIESLGEDVSMRQYELIVHEPNGTPLDKVFTGEVSRFGSLKTQRPPFDVKNPYLAEITENRELYKGSRSCMHIEVNIEGSKMRYESGDHIGVYPKNNDDLVNKIGSLLSVDLETIISLKNLDTESSKKHPFPCPTSYRTALQYYVDITNPPRTHILKELSEYASDEKEKAMLKLMGSSSDEGKAKYSDWVIKSCRSIVHILEDLPSCKPKLDHLLELLPRVQCRYYSISSSGKVYPNSVHLTAVMIEYETPTKRVNRGVTTSFLKSKPAKAGQTIPVFIRKSQFKLPSKTQVPIIMIGPGTGFAPFRGFLQERNWIREDGKPVGDTILYFGCRKREEDYLYREELEGYLNNGTLTKLYAAFSRDQKEKVYVTHLLRQNQEEVWDVIGNRNGHVYICGDARSMAKDVRDIILDVIAKFGEKSKSEAESFLKRMESQRRYSADVWS